MVPFSHHTKQIGIRMNSLTAFTGSTMDSREIAGLTGRKHKSVLRTINNMLTELEGSAPDSAHPYMSSFIGENGETYPCFQLPKRECLILAAGFNIKLRAAIIDRWAELESGKAVPLGVNPLTASNEELDIEINRQLNRIKMIVGEVSSGIKIATAMECQEKYAQRTGISIELPDYIKKYMVESDNIEFDPLVDTAFASKVAIGSNSINVSQWQKQFKHINSTRINDVLIKLGYATRINKSQVTPTARGREFCHTAVAASGYNVGKELIKGWKLDDRRFTDDVFPVLEELEDYLHQQWIINKKR